MINIYLEIEKLCSFAVDTKLIEKEDKIYCRNRLLITLKLDDWEENEVKNEVRYPSEILDNICQWAFEKGLIEDNSVTFRDLFDTELMNVFVSKPSDMINKFNSLYKESPKIATDFYYDFAKNSNYIRMDRVDKNVHWYSPTEYGHMEITINLSKPEKDPKTIALEKAMKSSSYPKCLLCVENEGYSGRVNHPARQNHRVIPVTLTGESWRLQYSPYVYYNEHCIVFSENHTPMKISRKSMEKLLDFIEIYPHYFVGSNADLPIVGGSILSHDHFQGGNHEFPMAKAPIEKTITFDGFPEVEAGIVKWPMSVVRIKSLNKLRLLDLAEKIYEDWKLYSNEDADIHAFSGEEPHNTVTPIARRRGEYFELDLVLRNNRTSEEHPMGIFHPHAEVHNIKKENIGLIEVMGLAVLPGRLVEEMDALSLALPKDNYIELISSDENIKKHIDMAKELKNNNQVTPENAKEILKNKIGQVFSIILEHAGVFKRDDNGMNAFEHFISFCNKR